MKTKILNALKTEYATMGLGEKAFDGVASFLVKTVTEESKIDEAIKGEDIKALLKAFQGESDSLRNKASQLQKEFDTYKAAHPDKAEPDDPKPDKVDDPKQAEFEKRLAEMERKYKEAEAKASAATSFNNIKARLEKDCTDAPILKQVLKGFSLGENETEDQAVTRLTAEYNDTVKEIRGEGYVPPMGNGGGQTQYQSGAFKSEVERLRAEGKIPNDKS